MMKTLRAQLSTDAKAELSPKFKSTTGAADAAPFEIIKQDAERQAAFLLSLVELEQAIRSTKTESELLTLIANEPLRLTGGRQIFVLMTGARGLKMAAVSSLVSFDANAPLVQSIERAANLNNGRGLGADKIKLIDSADLGEVKAIDAYPFPHLLWAPFTLRDKPIGCGMVLARDTPWSSNDHAVIERIAGSFAHGLVALRFDGRRDETRQILTRSFAIAAVLALFLLLVPVPLTVLAPFETGSQNFSVVTSPIDGIIEDVAVEPNAYVKAGDILIRLSDVALRNRMALAEHEVVVAEAKLIKTSQLAFSDLRGRHELGVVQAELQLKTAERDYAKDLLERSVIRAGRDGVAVFTDKRDLSGKPVQTGARLMEVSDPNHIELRIDVNANDAIALETGADVRAYFDSAPLQSEAAQIISADYQARQRPGNILAFRAVARLDRHAAPLPRLGSRGIAKVFGRKVSLGFYLFRRPLTAVRQRFGF